MKTMGKILAAVMAAVLLCTFSGCVIVEEEDDGIPPTRESDSSSDAAASEEEAAIQPVIFGLNEATVFGSQKITVTEWKESAGESIFTPDEGNVFVGVKIIVENISKEGKTFYVSPSQFNAYVDDVAYTDVLFHAGRLRRYDPRDDRAREKGDRLVRRRSAEGLAEVRAVRRRRFVFQIQGRFRLL